MNTKPSTIQNDDSTKIIQFPNSKIVREVPREQQLSREKKKTEKMSDALADEISDIVITELDNYGIDVDQKDFILIRDAIQATIYRQAGLEHHLHPFIDNNIRIIEGNLEEMSKEEIQAKIAEIVQELQEKSKDLDIPSE